MRSATKLFSVAAVGLLSLGLASTARAEDQYKIKLDRPFHVGDKFDVSITIKSKFVQKTDTPANDKDVRYTAVLSGTETIEAVSDESKQPTKFSWKIAKCTKDGKEMIPAGATVVAENVEGKTHVTVDGNDPDKDLEPILVDLFDTTDPNDDSSDDEMGTADAQKVGGTWKLNPDSVAKQFQKEQLPVDPADLKGGGKLEDVIQVEGKNVEKMSFKIDAEYDKKTLPGDVEVTDFKMHIQSTSTMPEDDSVQPPTTSAKVTLVMKMVTPLGKADITVDRSKEITIAPAK